MGTNDNYRESSGRDIITSLILRVVRGGWPHAVAETPKFRLLTQAGDIKVWGSTGLFFWGKPAGIHVRNSLGMWTTTGFLTVDGGFVFTRYPTILPSQAGWPEPEVASCSCWSRLSSWKAQCGVFFFGLILDWSWSVTSRLITCWLIILGLLWWFLIFYHYVILLVKTL